MDWVVLICSVIFVIFMAAPLLGGAPYLPSRKAAIEKMMELAAVGRGVKFADLGSGDGRVLIEAAKRGADATGFEINPILVLVSRYRIRKEGLADRARVYFKSFWRADFYEYDVLTIFGITRIMPALEKKILNELKPDGRVVSFAFRFPHWPYARVEDGVFLYKNPKNFI